MGPLSFGRVLDGALDVNLDLQHRCYDFQKILGTKAWLIEYATVRLDLGRQIGKTTAIKQRATSEDLVLLDRLESVRDFPQGAAAKPTVSIVPKSGLNLDTFRGMRFDRIWVDEATWAVSRDRLGYIYEIAFMTRAYQVILIG